MVILAIDTSTNYLSLAILRDGRLAAKYHRMADRKHSMLLVPTIEKLVKKARLHIGKIDCFAISAGPGSFTGLRIGVTVVKGLAYALRKRVVVVPTLDVIANNAKSFKGIICPVLDARKNKVYACLYKSDEKTIKKSSKYLLLSIEGLLRKLVTMKHNILLSGDIVSKIFTGDIERTLKLRSGGWGVQETQQHDTILLVRHARNFAYTRHCAQRNSPSERMRNFLPVSEGNLGCSMAGPVKIKARNWHPRAEIVGKLAIESVKNKKFVKAEDLEPLYLYSRECDIKGV